MRGKIIVIEGTDCSGKETQSKKLIERLNNENIKCKYFCFPKYDSPTGRIIGGPYLGKSYICDGWFSEGADKVDSKVGSLFYAADRLYNFPEIEEVLSKGINVVLDRYTYSNMAHQGGKILDENKRLEMYKWLEELEFNLIKLPLPDIKVFLHVPFEASVNLKKDRIEKLDQHEANEEHLRHAERAYLEIVDLYGFKKIECINDNQIKTIDEINDILYNYVIEQLR